MKNDTQNVDTYLAALPDWQKQHLQSFRETIHERIEGVTEEIKWNVPVFVSGGKVLFAMSAFKEHTKYNFILNGALLDDSNGLFNNGLESKKSRGIDLRQGESIDREKLSTLIDQAFAKTQ